MPKSKVLPVVHIESGAVRWLPISEIIVIKSIEREIRISTFSDEYKLLDAINDLAELLFSMDFLKIDRSALANVTKAAKFDKIRRELEFKNMKGFHRKIDVSRRNVPSIAAHFNT